jgi:hypothetical protein
MARVNWDRAQREKNLDGALPQIRADGDAIWIVGADEDDAERASPPPVRAQRPRVVGACGMRVVVRKRSR